MRLFRSIATAILVLSASASVVGFLFWCISLVSEKVFVIAALSLIIFGLVAGLSAMLYHTVYAPNKEPQ